MRKKLNSYGRMLNITYGEAHKDGRSGALRNHLLTLLFIVLILLIQSCDSFERWVAIDVEYRVSGTAETVDITIENEEGGVSQYADVEIPWIYSGKFDRGAFVYVSAQNQGYSGSVTVEIYQEGRRLRRSESEGAFVIATASGSLNE
jgi:hypothetical protein